MLGNLLRMCVCICDEMFIADVDLSLIFFRLLIHLLHLMIMPWHKKSLNEEEIEREKPQSFSTLALFIW